MTLVEVLIAMGIFAVITTGFCMSASYALKAQAKAKKRLTETNNQTTNLEHYSGVIDFDAAKVRQLDGGTNQWTMIYDFPSATLVNDKLHGYTSVTDDPVFQLGFFSAIDRINLASNEYWFTVYNYGSEQQNWDISCASGFVFFDNEGKTAASPQELPTHLVAGDGYALKFGIRNVSGGSISGGVITFKEWGTGTTIATLGLDNYIDSDRYGFIYFDGATFLNATDFDATYVPAEPVDE